ncbi:MAG TPA: HAMP domain-containing sensor histidine kinase [Planctomycetota bacterium]|nr:HAMP domain-containing sensor histidine kinase [Planctomycetota bacterium]
MGTRTDLAASPPATPAAVAEGGAKDPTAPAAAEAASPPVAPEAAAAADAASLPAAPEAAAAADAPPQDEELFEGESDEYLESADAGERAESETTDEAVLDAALDAALDEEAVCTQVMPAPSSESGRDGAGNLMVLLLGGIFSALSGVLVYALAAGHVPLPIAIAPAACVAALIFPLAAAAFAVHLAKRAARRRVARITAALERLGIGMETGLPPDDPFAAPLDALAWGIEERQAARLAQQADEIARNAHHEVTRVRSQCENLIEKHTERLHIENKELSAAIHREAAGRIQAESDAVELKERVAFLEKSLREVGKEEAKDRETASLRVDELQAQVVRLEGDLGTVLEKKALERQEWEVRAAKLREQIMTLETELSEALDREAGWRGEAGSRAAKHQEDLTALAKERDALRDATGRLEEDARRLTHENSQLKSQGIKFFDKVAAQLRGPVRIIGNLARDLASKSVRSLEDTASEIQVRIRRLDRLVDQVLELSRIRSCGLSLVFSKVDGGDLLQKCMKDVSDTAAAKDITLTRKVSKPSPMVETDARLLQRILRELLTNAVRFSPHGAEVAVSLSIVRSPEELGHIGTRRFEECLRVEVQDSGPGIPIEERDRVFEAFERGKEPQFTLSDAGAGLGLTLTKEYARTLGGQIHLETGEGSGSLFIVLLPVKVLPAGKQK